MEQPPYWHDLDDRIARLDDLDTMVGRDVRAFVHEALRAENDLSADHAVRFYEKFLALERALLARQAAERDGADEREVWDAIIAGMREECLDLLAQAKESTKDRRPVRATGPRLVWSDRSRL